MEERFKFSEPDFEVLVHLLNSAGVDGDKIKTNLEQIHTRLKRIFNDQTATEAMKIANAAELYREYGKELLLSFESTKEEVEEAIHKAEANRYPNKLRAKPLTGDQKVLLPLVKEQYEKTGDITKLPSYHKQLLFLSDNGLIASVEAELNQFTPEEYVEHEENVKKAKNFLLDMHESAKTQIRNILEDESIKKIVESRYKH